jgi:hypothetical protein
MTALAALTLEDRLTDLATFGQLLTATQDHDPIYPLMRQVIADQGLDAEQAAWLVYVYLTFYNTSSAWLAFTRFPDYWALNERRAGAELRQWEATHRRALHINIERRGLRGGQWVPVWRETIPIVGPSLWAWLSMSFDGTPTENYETLWVRMQTLSHVGRWAAFKWLDLLQHVLGAPVEAPDMRMAYCSGPRHALEELFGLDAHANRQDPPYIAYLDQLGAQVRDFLAARQLPLSWDLLETVLCNYHSLTRGRYYVGHDIDEHLENTQHGAGERGPWLTARQTVLDHRLLGEKHGWTGVRKPLKRVYRDQRHIHCDWHT